MQKASEVIEQHPGQLTKSGAAGKVGGKKDWAWKTITALENEGYIESKKGSRGYGLYWSVRPYREADDPLSDRYAPGGNASTRSSPSEGVPVPVPPLGEGNTGNTSSSRSREHLGNTGNTLP